MVCGPSSELVCPLPKSQKYVVPASASVAFVNVKSAGRSQEDNLLGKNTVLAPSNLI